MVAIPVSMFFTGLVNRALINMAKQLYYSELHLKDNEIY